MKKFAFSTVFLLLSCVIFGQPLQKGNLVGTHLVEIELKPGVTMEQFQEFYINKAIPAFEKAREGWKVHLVKGIRGDNEGRLGLIIVIESEEARDKYYNEDNSLSKLGEESSKKFAPVREEMEKLVTFKVTFTDWLVL